MRAEIALGRSVVVGINVESIVRTSLHASLATDAEPVVEINDTVRPPVQGAGGTDLGARRVIAMVAPHHPEVARAVGKLTLFDMLHPSAKYAHRHLVLLFAGDRAGMTPNTPILIDDKSVSHLLTFRSHRMPKKRFQLRHHS
jgi:hypothetical protein